MGKKIVISLAIITVVCLAFVIFTVTQPEPQSIEFPYYSQENEYYCGEACMQMILEFYDVEPPSQSILAEEADFKDTETPCSGMPKPFENRNFQVQITTNKNYSEAYTQLIEILDIKPIIVLITWNNGVGHYLVVFQYNLTGIFYHDPGYIPDMYVDYDDFRILWLDNCLAREGQPTCWALIVTKENI